MQFLLTETFILCYYQVNFDLWIFTFYLFNSGADCFNRFAQVTSLKTAYSRNTIDRFDTRYFLKQRASHIKVDNIKNNLDLLIIPF